MISVYVWIALTFYYKFNWVQQICVAEDLAMQITGRRLSFLPHLYLNEETIISNIAPVLNWGYDHFNVVWKQQFINH